MHVMHETVMPADADGFLRCSLGKAATPGLNCGTTSDTPGESTLQAAHRDVYSCSLGTPISTSACSMQTSRQPGSGQTLPGRRAQFAKTGAFSRNVCNVCKHFPKIGARQTGHRTGGANDFADVDIVGQKTCPMTDPRGFFCISGRSSAPAMKEQRVLERLYESLQQLSPAGRRKMFLQNFVQSERLFFEFWVVCRRRALACRSRHAAAATADQGDEHYAAEREPMEVAGGPDAIQTRGDKHVWSHGLANDSGIKRKRAASQYHLNRSFRNAKHLHVPARGPGADGRAGSRRELAPVKVFRCRDGAFQSSVCFNSFCITCQQTTSLHHAREWATIAHNIRRVVANRLDLNAETFQVAVKRAVQEVSAAHGKTVIELGFKYNLQISIRAWTLSPLHTPTSRSIDDALSDWTRLAHLARVSSESLCVDDSHKQLARRPTISPVESESQWLTFKEAYLDILEMRGHSRECATGRLSRLEAATADIRQARAERWARYSMAGEDDPKHQPWRLRSRRLPDPCGEETRRAKRLRRVEIRERAAMAVEDRLGKAARKAAKIAARNFARCKVQAETLDSRSSRAAEHCLRRWRRLRTRGRRKNAVRNLRHLVTA